MKTLLSIAVLLCASTVYGAEPPKVKGYASADDVEALKARVAALEKALKAQSCECPKATAVPNLAPVRGADRHVSPDGTVNELCADGIYRPVPGLAKVAPPVSVSAPQYLYAPTYSLPSFGGCPGGRCPTR